MALIIDKATECRERALKALSDLPPFSPVLDRLLATLSSENSSMAKISGIVETDTVIAGNVLKLVNSALYGRRGTVNSVRHAVSLLGINKLRNTVFAMSISRVWNQVKTAPGWSMARFNLHSVACALVCDNLAQTAAVEYAEGAFAAGLFHNVGSLLIAVGMPAELQEIRTLRSTTSMNLRECEYEVLGTTHAELSAAALSVWNLPAAIQAGVRFHQEPASDPTPKPGDAARLSLAVRCACDYLELSDIAPDDDCINPAPVKEPFLPLGINVADARFLDSFQAELSLLGGMLK